MKVTAKPILTLEPRAEELHLDAVPFGMTGPEARIAELARMAPFDYEQCRRSEAKNLNMRVSILDEMIEAKRPKLEVTGNDPNFQAVEPWDQPVNGSGLLAELQATILQFCILPQHSAPLMAVWVLHSWAFDAAAISPVLAIVSPEKRCGKTTALSLLSHLVPCPVTGVNLTAAVMFRVIDRYKPTLLIDEADTFLNDDKNGDLRGMLNGGHNRNNAFVWRCDGENNDPRRYRVWAPKCVAMIGRLPDTLEDRSLVVKLRRKRSGEKVKRFRGDRGNDFLHLRRKAARWTADNLPKLSAVEPEVPDQLHDREQDNARPLCAIAEVAGEHWPSTIRKALIGLAERISDDPQTDGVRLLSDIKAVFRAKVCPRIGSTELSEALHVLEESPWSEWRGGRSISTRGIAMLLKPFGVRSRQEASGSFYHKADFVDAFDRYLSDTGRQDSATCATSATADPSATKKSYEIKGDGTWGLDSELSDHKRHDGEWEGDI